MKHLLLVCLLLVSVFAKAEDKKVPFFYNEIANQEKSINFIFGFYPTTCSFTEGKEGPSYTSVKSAIINNAKQYLPWSDYKVLVLLTSGQLVRSYSTNAAADSNYMVNYLVTPGATRYQYFCFHAKFTTADIDKVWLVLGDELIYGLVLNKGDK